MRMLIFGQTQTGKTYYAHSLVSDYIRGNKHDRYVITDKHTDQYQKNLSDMGFSKVTLDKFKPDHINWYKLLQKEPRLFIHLSDMSNEQLISHMTDLANDISLLGNTFLVLDEAWEVWGVNKNLPDMESLVRAGEKTGIGWIFLTQQPIDVGMTLRQQADIFTTFRISEGRHLNKIYDYMGERKIIKEKVPALDEREYFQYNKKTQELIGPVSSDGVKMEV